MQASEAVPVCLGAVYSMRKTSTWAELSAQLGRQLQQQQAATAATSRNIAYLILVPSKRWQELTTNVKLDAILATKHAYLLGLGVASEGLTLNGMLTMGRYVVVRFEVKSGGAAAKALSAATHVGHLHEVVKSISSFARKSLQAVAYVKLSQLFYPQAGVYTGPHGGKGEFVSSRRCALTLRLDLKVALCIQTPLSIAAPPNWEECKWPMELEHALRDIGQAQRALLDGSAGEEGVRRHRVASFWSVAY